MSAQHNNTEIRQALIGGLEECDNAIGLIAERVLLCAQGLRANPDQGVFDAMGTLIDNLRGLTELVRGIGDSVSALGVSSAPLAAWGRGPRIFAEMGSAFERNDWVALADLLQYELHPMLAEGREGFGVVLSVLKK